MRSFSFIHITGKKVLHFRYKILDLTLLALKLDDTSPDARRNNSQFATAARRALLLYVPFTDFHRFTDIGQLADPNLPVDRYGPH